MARMNEIDISKYYKNNKDAKGTAIKDSKKDNKTASKYRKRLSGRTLSETNGEYWDYIMLLINTAEQYTQQERNEIAEETAEYYYKQTGYIMPNEMLTALSDFLLSETLFDSSTNKSQLAEYAILSNRQIAHRAKKEHSMETDIIEYFEFENRNNTAHKKHTTERSLND